MQPFQFQLPEFMLSFIHTQENERLKNEQKKTFFFLWHFHPKSSTAPSEFVFLCSEFDLRCPPQFSAEWFRYTILAA